MKTYLAFSAVLLSAIACSKPSGVSEPLTSFVRGPNGTLREVKYVEVDGLGIYEGDIIIGTADELRDRAKLGRDKLIREGFGISLDSTNHLWTTRAIPYVFGPTLKPQVGAALISTLATFNSVGITFVPRTNQPDYIIFASNNEPVGGSSYVGRVGGAQTVVVNELSAAVHEIGHLLGLEHEQTRPDRDSYVRIDLSNVIPEYRFNFDKNRAGDREVFGAYDFSSVMHYPPFSFCLDCRRPTITTLSGSTVGVGGTSSLTSADINALQRMYTFTPSLIGIKVRNTGSGKLEMHSLTRQSSFQTFNYNLALPLPVNVASSFQYFGVGADLALLQTTGTASGKLELHILSAASGYQQYSYHAIIPIPIGEAANYRYCFVGADLLAVKVANFKSTDWNQGRSVFYNVYEKVTGYQSIFSRQTSIESSEAAKFTFLGGGRSLIAIKTRNTASGYIEVNKSDIETQADSKFITTISALAADTLSFKTFEDDILAVKTTSTGTGRVETHVLSASSGYRQFSLQVGIPISLADGQNFTFATRVR